MWEAMIQFNASEAILILHTTKAAHNGFLINKVHQVRKNESLHKGTTIPSDHFELLYSIYFDIDIPGT